MSGFNANIINLNIPASYDESNLYNGMIRPSTVHVRDNATQRFFRKYLVQKAMSVFKWTLPEEWDKDFFLYVLYGAGYLAVINHERYGVIPQNCALGGYNVFYRPSYAIITNPLFRKSITANIGKDCTIIKLQPDYCSIMDLVNYYADKLTLASEAIDVNLVNTKTATIFAAKDKTQAESYKKMFDRVTNGEPAVVIDKNLFDDEGKPNWTPFNQSIKESYIVPDVLSDMRKIESMLDTDIGIPNANTDKKERLVTDEVNANNVETATRCELWLESLKKGIEETNAMFGTSLAVDWRVDPKNDIQDSWEGGSNNGNSNSNGSV